MNHEQFYDAVQRASIAADKETINKIYNLLLNLNDRLGVLEVDVNNLVMERLKQPENKPKGKS